MLNSRETLKYINTCVVCNNNFSCRRKHGKYCSRECYSRSKRKIYLKNEYESIEKTLSRIIIGARYRSKNKKKIEFNLTYKQVLNILKEQNYKCARTGVELLPSKRDGYSSKYPETISIDRVDSNKGYTLDNIQLVSTIYNFCKNNFTEEQVKDMCVNYIKFNNINIHGE